MQILKRHNQRLNIALLTGFMLTLAMMIYNLPNVGNNLMPRNFLAWVGIVMILTPILILQFGTKTLRWHQAITGLFLPPLAILIHSIILPPTEFGQYYVWTTAGATFLFALALLAMLQLRVSRNAWLFLASTLLVVITVQMYLSTIAPKAPELANWVRSLPIELNAKFGGFQQRNLMASFLSASVLWVWYLMLKGKNHSLVEWLGFAAVSYMAAWGIYDSSSRVGSLSILFGVGAFVSFSLFKKQFKSLIPAIAIVLAITPTLSNEKGVVAKASKGVEHSSITVRVDFLNVSAELFQQAPMLGHGIGNFSEKYNEQSIARAKEGVPQRHLSGLLHPHNETAMWAVETGTFGLLFIVLPFTAAIIWLVIKKSAYPVLALIAIFPIALHSQVEMPLQASGIHWWLVAMILGSSFRAHLSKPIALPKPRLNQIGIGIAGILATLTLSDAAMAAHQRWLLAVHGPSQMSAAKYIQAIHNSPAANHWILKTDVLDVWSLRALRLGNETKNIELIEAILPRVEEGQSRWYSTAYWLATSGAYHALGESQKLEQHWKNINLVHSPWIQQISGTF